MTINTVLNEGIKYFKFSSRIESYVKKLNKKEVKDEELKNLIKELNVLQKSFRKLEKEYKSATEKSHLKSIKQRWEILQVKNERLLRLIKKEEMKKAAIIFGIFAILLAILLLIKKGIDSNLSKIEDELKGKRIVKDGQASGTPYTSDSEKNGERIVADQINNSKIGEAVEFYKGFAMPKKGEYSKQDLIIILKDVCDKNKFPFEIAKAVAKAESTLDTRAISPDGNSLGLMQLNVKYKDTFANDYYYGNPKEFNPFNPRMNAEAGVRYLKYLIKQNNGDLREALLDYNAGMNRTKTTEGTIRYADKIIASLAHGTVLQGPK